MREVHDEYTDICNFLQRIFQVTWDSCECCGISIDFVVLARLLVGICWYGWVDVFNGEERGGRLYCEVHGEFTTSETSFEVT